jgi:hypothetical protein
MDAQEGSPRRENRLKKSFLESIKISSKISQGKINGMEGKITSHRFPRESLSQDGGRGAGSRGCSCVAAF